MKLKLQYGFIVILALLVIGLAYVGVQQKDEAENLKRKLEQNPPPTKVTKNELLEREEVAHYQELLEEKIDEFLQGEYDDDNIFKEGTAGRAFYGIFSPTGIAGVTEDSTKEEIRKRYKPFEYKLYNLTAQRTSNGEVEIYTNIEVRYDDKKVEIPYNLLQVVVDENDVLKRGSLYAQQGK